MHDPVVSHQSQRLQHLTSEPPNQSRCEPNETIRLDEFIQVDTKQFHRNAQMATEIEMFGHFDNMVLFVLILHMTVSTV